MSDFLTRVADWPDLWKLGLWLLVALAFSIVVGLLLKAALFRTLRYYARSTDFYVLDAVARHLSTPISWLLPIFLLNLVLPQVPFAEFGITSPVTVKLAQVLLILFIGWTLMRVLSVVQDVIYHQYSLDAEDNLSARKVRTQTQFIKRLASIVVFILTLSAVLISFENVRRFGTGLLTSAGVTGIIIGFAAQRSIANLIAGFQIAFTQPIRIDDVVIVENEWGRVEEITLTYVVVRIWDKRRMVLPITYFIEKPFQNWTRASADIIGTVFFHTDYTMPIEPLRQHLTELLQKSKLWDGVVNVLQVVEATDRTVQLRALVSARNSGDAWDLRCYIRENMIQFVQQHYPASLPYTRAYLLPEAGVNRENGFVRPEQHSPRAEEGDEVVGKG